MSPNDFFILKTFLLTTGTKASVIEYSREENRVAQIFKIFDILQTKMTERQRDRETERQRDRETERQRDRETERQRDRETERQRGRETERKRDKGTERQRDRHRQN
jgi:hypothetical protein